MTILLIKVYPHLVLTAQKNPFFKVRVCKVLLNTYFFLEKIIKSQKKEVPRKSTIRTSRICDSFFSGFNFFSF